jgi:hypothetical protein
MAEMQKDLMISEQQLLQQLSILRGLGAAATLTTYDPRPCGRPFQTINLLRMRDHTLPTLIAFERDLVADEAVATADYLTGEFSFRLSAFHRDRLEAALWARGLLDRGAVAEVVQHPVQVVFGNELSGMALRASRKVRAARGSRRATQ